MTMKDDAADDCELVKVDAAEIRDLLSRVSPEEREKALFAIGLANLRLVSRVRNPSKSVQ
jgi:hypothetical protein